MTRVGKPTREHWNSLPPKRCPACERVLPRSEFSVCGGRCRACLNAHRRAQRAPKQAEAAPPSRGCPPFPGIDFMAKARRELFPTRPYNLLGQEACRAVRHRALELLAAHAAANPPAEPRVA